MGKMEKEIRRECEEEEKGRGKRGRGKVRDTYMKLVHCFHHCDLHKVCHDNPIHNDTETFCTSLFSVDSDKHTPSHTHTHTHTCMRTHTMHTHARTPHHAHHTHARTNTHTHTHFTIHCTLYIHANIVSVCNPTVRMGKAGISNHSCLFVYSNTLYAHALYTSLTQLIGATELANHIYLLL